MMADDETHICSLCEHEAGLSQFKILMVHGKTRTICVFICPSCGAENVELVTAGANQYLKHCDAIFFDDNPLLNLDSSKTQK